VFLLGRSDGEAIFGTTVKNDRPWARTRGGTRLGPPGLERALPNVAAARDHWARQAQNLAAALRAELGTRAELVVDLWPLENNK
jgi:hypothetical protein